MRDAPIRCGLLVLAIVAWAGAVIGAGSIASLLAWSFSWIFAR